MSQLDQSLPSTFGYLENGFFRNRNCVSLFDYRPEPSQEILDFRCRCSPFQAARPGKRPIAILILNPQVGDSLIPWTRWQEEQSWGEIVVPHVEAGYAASLSTELIDEVICLTLVEDPASLVAILTRHIADTPDGRITRDLPVQLSGLYKGNQAQNVTVLQDDVQRTSDGFVVHIRVVLRHDSHDSCGTTLWQRLEETRVVRSPMLICGSH